MVPRVSSYMSSPVYVVRPEDSLAYARNLMLKRGIGRLVVVGDGYEPVGIITYTDIARALMEVFPERPIESILVEEVMTENPITITSTRGLNTAAHVMLKHKISGLPVIDRSGSLIGIITKTDIVRAFSERYKGVYKVADIARKGATTAKPGHSIRHILNLSLLDPAGKVVIVDEEGKPIGIIARRDLAFLRWTPELAARKGREAYVKRKIVDPGRDRLVAYRVYSIPLASDIMTEDPLTVKPDDDAALAAGLMVKEGIGALPVTSEKGVLMGIVTKNEILQAVITGSKH